MKKVLAVIAVVAVVCAAGAACAQGNARGNNRPMVNRPMMPMMQGQQFQPRGQFDGEDMGGFCGRGRGHGRMMFAPDMPEEIRAKAVEAAKLRIDLEAEMSAKTIDKAKAMEIFAKVQKAENEIDTWKFGKRLEMMEAFRTQRELNRKVPPARRMQPAPEAPEAPAPEE